MSVPVKMPRLGETVIEGTVAHWLKAPGEPVAKLEPLLEINTDKIDTEVPAPADGTLLRIVVPEGKTVQAGTVLAYIGDPGEVLPKPSPVQDGAEVPKPQFVLEQLPAHADGDGNKPMGREFISPVVARIAAEHEVNLEQVPGTGMGGRVTKKDVLAFVARQAAASALSETRSLRARRRSNLCPQRWMKCCSRSRQCAGRLHSTWCRASELAPM